MRLGIMGGGEVGRMLAQAASVLGIEVCIFTPQADAPALQVTPYHIIGSWDDEDCLRRLADQCDVMTIENSALPAEVFSRLEALGLTLHPGPAVLAQALDRYDQRRALEDVVDMPRYRRVSVATDVLDAAQEFGFPVVLRARRGAEEGENPVLIRRAHDIAPALERLRGQGDLMVESVVNGLRELAVTIVRSAEGALRIYPVVEVVRRNNLCHIVRCPAPIEEATAYRATEMARTIVEHLGGVGAFCVGMLERAGEEVLFRHLTAYPDESGHYTIEGVITSQFENHIRAVCGLPLGDVAQIAPATVMFNLLGERNGPANPTALHEALATEGVHFHLYGWREVQPGRRMGHINVLGYNIDGAEKVGLLAQSRVKL